MKLRSGAGATLFLIALAFVILFTAPIVVGSATRALWGWSAFLAEILLFCAFAYLDKRYGWTKDYQQRLFQRERQGRL